MQQGPFSAPEQITLLFLQCLVHSFIVLFLSWDKKRLNNCNLPALIKCCSLLFTQFVEFALDIVYLATMGNQPKLQLLWPWL